MKKKGGNYVPFILVVESFKKSAPSLQLGGHKVQPTTHPVRATADVVYLLPSLRIKKGAYGICTNSAPAHPLGNALERGRGLLLLLLFRHSTKS